MIQYGQYFANKSLCLVDMYGMLMSGITDAKHNCIAPKLSSSFIRIDLKRQVIEIA